MFTTASKESRRFDSKVADFFLTSVEKACHVFAFHLFFRFLQLLLFSGAQSFLLSLFGFKVFKHRPKITQSKIGDNDVVML